MNQTIDKKALEKAAEIALEQAKKQGATSAEVGVSRSQGLSVSVRQGDVETLEYNNDTGLGITVYFGQSKASASTSDLRPEAIADAVKAASGIAKHTQADEYAGLADPELMATEFPDLSLYHPWEIEAEQAIAIATECERSGFDYDARITNSEGASVSSHQGARVYANSHGFMGATISSRHSVACTLIANDDRGMQRDYWYDTARDAADLESVTAIGQHAANNTIR
jgi:PmbA protein